MSISRIIWVSPLAEGWTVMCTGLEPLIFQSGGRAEAQAKRLALALAEAGPTVQVRILDRARNLVGTQFYPAF